MNPGPQPQKAPNLHHSALVCDLTVPWVQIGRADLRNRTLPRMAKSGVNFVSLTVASDAESLLDILDLLARERRIFREKTQDYRIVETVEDILAAKKGGQLAVSFNLQGTNALAGNLERVSLLYDLGVRQMLLAYNRKNLVGDGCHERTDAGLSEFGVNLIAEMNRVGMIVDCSHTGYRTSMEAMEVTNAPVIFSHSNPKTLWEHDRNIRDDQASACASTGGLVGVVGVGIFMGDNIATTEMLARQIDYYVELIGPGHVGLGLDYVYDVEAEQAYMASVKSPQRGNYDKMTAFFQPEQLPELTDLLLAKGYPESAIRGILGENFLRVARAVWR
ncbi:membrane dipeptidase [Mesorhizobium sp. M0276]|uniref:dipeptidase n=1 Tax=Mesorhizobium sp. M0276 TaxID=2956928 RepID=UPI00333554BD